MLLYPIFLLLYRTGIRASALYNGKARKWLDGRRNWRQQLAAALTPGEKRIWIHCSSLGEFEQGRPLIEALKEQYPDHKIVLTFFSPSGYEACRSYDKADHICYLPMDGRAAARDFVAAVSPSLVLFVKYEFWHYYLAEVKRRQMPLLLVSGAFRPEQPFFKWYGGFFRKMLHCFTHIHVQDGVSAKLLQAIGIRDNVTISGDTRYDRVSAIAARVKQIPEAERFKGTSKIFIAGSTWPDDERLIKECLPQLPSDWKLVIAPHEIDARHIRQVQELFGSEMALFSELPGNAALYDKRILVIDNIGMLSSLYTYGAIAYVGGGFQKGGIHNVLEPAVFGIPVIIGPIYQKFVEAASLVSAKAAFPVNNATEAGKLIHDLATDDTARQSIRDILQKFMKKKVGATAKIMAQIREKNWL